MYYTVVVPRSTEANTSLDVLSYTQNMVIAELNIPVKIFLLILLLLLLNYRLYWNALVKLLNM